VSNSRTSLALREELSKHSILVDVRPIKEREALPYSMFRVLKLKKEVGS